MPCITRRHLTIQDRPHSARSVTPRHSHLGIGTPSSTHPHGPGHPKVHSHSHTPHTHNLSNTLGPEDCCHTNSHKPPPLRHTGLLSTQDSTVATQLLVQAHPQVPRDVWGNPDTSGPHGTPRTQAVHTPPAQLVLPAPLPGGLPGGNGERAGLTSLLRLPPNIPAGTSGLAPFSIPSLLSRSGQGPTSPFP